MIHQIQIRNFKSLRDVTVDLSPVTVFIGKSGTGKTNFASAIRFLRDYLAGPNQTQYERCATNPRGTALFRIVFDAPGFEERFTYSLELSEQLNQPLMESLEHGSKTVFKQSLPQGPRWETPPALVSVPPAGAVALGRLPGLEEAVIAHTVLTTAIGVYMFPFDVLRASGQRSGVPGFADAGHNYLDVIDAITRNLQDFAIRKAIFASLKRINETIVSVELNSVQNPQKALVGHRFRDKTLTLDLSVSRGEKGGQFRGIRGPLGARRNRGETGASWQVVA